MSETKKRKSSKAKEDDTASKQKRSKATASTTDDEDDVAAAAAASGSDQQNGGSEEQTSILPIEMLEERGISMGDINKLKEAGYHTISAVCMSMKRKLTQVRGFSDAKVDKLLVAASQLDRNMGFTTGFEAEQDRKGLCKITTGSKEFDNLLQGGIPSGEITELYGEFGSGKTQVSHTLAVTCQLAKAQGGGEGKCMFIDTEKTFRPERIRQIAERFGLDGDAVLNNIIYAKAYNSDHQLMLASQAQQVCMENAVSLIVVDSIMANYRTDYTGRGELAERQQHLGQFMKCLINLADTYRIAVLITNQVMSNPDGMSAMFGNIPKPIGGHVLGHASATRIFLRKAKEHARKATIADSTVLPKSACEFELSDGGVCDAS